MVTPYGNHGIYRFFIGEHIEEKKKIRGGRSNKHYFTTLYILISFLDLLTSLTSFPVIAVLFNERKKVRTIAE